MTQIWHFSWVSNFDRFLGPKLARNPAPGHPQLRVNLKVKKLQKLRVEKVYSAAK